MGSVVRRWRISDSVKRKADTFKKKRIKRRDCTMTGNPFTFSNKVQGPCLFIHVFVDDGINNSNSGDVENVAHRTFGVGEVDRFV